MEPENISVNILYSDTLKSIGLSCTLNGFYLYMIYDIKHWLFGKYQFTVLFSLPNVNTFHYTIYIFLIPTGLIGRAFKYWEAVKLLVNKSSLKSAFFLKGHILSLATNTVSCFP